MEVELFVPIGIDVSIIREHYPDLCEDESCYIDGESRRLWCGNSLEEDESEFEWFTYEEAIEFCGFCEGAIDGAETLIEGNGGWAQGMIKERDFSRFAVTDEQKAEWKARSDLYWSAYERGQKAKGGE